MEIENCEYVRNQETIVAKLRDISFAMRDILFALDDDLSETIGRRNESAFNAVSIFSNTLRDYEEELENICRKYLRAKKQKGE